MTYKSTKVVGVCSPPWLFAMIIREEKLPLVQMELPNRFLSNCRLLLRLLTVFCFIPFLSRLEVLCVTTSHCSLLTLYPDKINIGVTSKSVCYLGKSKIFPISVGSETVTADKIVCCMSANVSVHLLLAAHILHSKRLVERTSKLVINVDALIVCMS